MKRFGIPLAIAVFAASASAFAYGRAEVDARGASNVSGRFELRAKGKILLVKGELRGMTPGPYRVLLLPECPPEPRPTDLKSGRVREGRRSGLERKPIPGSQLEAGSFIANDREEAEFELSVARARVAEWPRIAVALREGDAVNPPLSDRFGLIACTPFVGF